MTNLLFLKAQAYKVKHPKKTYFLCFTFLFLLTFFCFFIIFFINHKSFIWKGETKDGLVQHYNSLMYYGSYLRNIVKNILFKHQFVLPMWDFSIGYGADVLSTFHYYVMGDPLNLLSIFVIPKYTEYLYMFLIFLRLYLAGLSFSYYCLFMKQGKKATLIASITYVFCGYCVFVSVRHPYFINPMIYLPLLAIGVEKIYQNESARLFIVMVALSALSNFYFFYMLCLLIIIYALIRYFDIYGVKHLKNIPILLGKFIFYGLVGICIAAIILFPVIFFFISSSRSGYKVSFDQIYSLNYYLSAFLNFNSYNFSGYWTICGFSALSVLSIMILFLKKHHFTIKVGFVVMTLCLCVPYVGYIFNGFSYLSNRWIFGYSFMVGIVVCWTFEDLLFLSKKEYVKLGVIGFIYFLIAMLFEETRNLNFMMSMIITFIVYILIGFYQNRNKKAFLFPVIVIFTIISVSLNAFFKYSPSQLYYIKEFVEMTEGYSSIKNTRAKAVKKLGDAEFFRYDGVSKGSTYLINDALQQRQRSVSFFYSLGSGYVTEYFDEMKNVNALSSLYTGLNYRSYLEALASVKYFVSESNQKQYIPFGYNTEVDTSKTNSIYQTDYSLPLGYTYDTRISREEYNALSSLKKQQALLQSVCVDGDVQMNTKDIQFLDEKSNYKVDSSHGIKKTENGFEVLEKDAYIVLQFDGQKNSELYTEFNHLIFQPRKNARGDYIMTAQIVLESKQVSQSLTLRNEYNTYYNGHQDFLMNLGYSSDQRNEMKITFKTPGNYICDEMNIYHLSMESFPHQIEERRKSILENVEIGTNKVSGDITLDSQKFLCLSIPYSEGWTVYVDGQEETLYRANTMYMGVLLSEGDHHIELYYTTPFIKTGILCSTIGLIAFMIMGIYERKRKLC